MSDFHAIVQHDEYERACSRIERHRLMYVPLDPYRVECEWWDRHLDLMMGMIGWRTGGWFSVIGGWLDALDGIGVPVDGARDEIERLQKEAI